MKLTKDGVDVCEMGLITFGPPHVERQPKFLGSVKSGGEKTERTYYGDCPIPVKFTGGGNFALEDGGEKAPIRPFDYETTETKDDFGKTVHRMRFTALWPEGWLV